MQISSHQNIYGYKPVKFGCNRCTAAKNMLMVDGGFTTEGANKFIKLSLEMFPPEKTHDEKARIIYGNVLNNFVTIIANAKKFFPELLQ